MKIALATALMFFAFGSAAHAATVNEGAAPGGDYADALGASGNILGAIPLGFTTVSGAMRCNSAACTGGLNDQFDAFYFDVAEGTRAKDISVNAEGGSDPFDPSDPLLLRAQLIDDAGATVFSQVFEINETLNLSNILLEGRYNFAISFENIASFTNGGNASYTTEVFVESIAPIPLPASLPLLLAGFGGLMALRRRKSRA